jgi:DNA-directed RNA polymerase beta' subunit
MTRPTATRDVVRLSLVGPDDVRRWSSGEVTQARAHHPKSGRPVPGGLFCEEIFGPLVEWRCRCGQLAGPSHRHERCGRCGKPVLQRRGRRQRMGHVELAAPVAHIWFVRARPAPLAVLLGLEPGEVEKVVYGESSLVVASRSESLPVGRVLGPRELDRAAERFGPAFTVETGAAALEKALAALDLEALARKLREELAAPKPARAAVAERLRLVESMRRSGVSPAWMILRVLPVVGPALRPVVRLGSGRQASSELNDLYRRVIRCNNGLRESLKEDAPLAILREQRLALQHAADALLDNRRGRLRIEGPRRRPVKSLSEALSGKQGRFRGHLLGKRVDYSGRSVIVVGPELKLHQCGLPLAMALDLFEPLLLGQLIREGRASTLRRGRQLLDSLANPGAVADCARLIVAELGRGRELEQAGKADTGEARTRGGVLLAELPTTQEIAEVRDCLEKDGAAAAEARARCLLDERQARLRALVERVVAGHPVLLNRAPTLHRMGVQAFEPVLVEGNAIRLHPLACKAFNADFDGDQMAVHLPLSEEAIAEAFALMTPAGNLYNPASGQLIVAPSQDIVLGCYYLTVNVEGPTVTDHGSGMTFASRDEVLLAYDSGKVGTHARIRVRHDGGRVLQERDDQEEMEDLPRGKLLATSVGRVVFNAQLPAGLPFYNLTLDSRRLALIFRHCRQRLGRRGAVEAIDRIKEVGFAFATRSGLSFATDDVPALAEKPALLDAARRRAEALRRAVEEGSLDARELAPTLREVWARAQKDITEPLRRLLRHDTRGGRPYLNPLHAMADSKARGSIDQIRQLAGMRGAMAGLSGRGADRPITASLREGLPSWDYFASGRGGRKGLTDKGVRTAEAGYLTRKLVACCQQVVVTEEDCGTTLGIVKRVHKGTLASRVEGRVSMETLHDEAGRELVREGELVSAGQARMLAELDLQDLRVRSPLACRAARGVCRRCYGIDLATRQLVEVGAAVGIVAAQSIGEPGTQLTMRTFHGGGEAGKDIVNDLERVTRFFEASPAASGVDLRQMLDESGPDAVADYLLVHVRELYRVHGLQIDDRHLEVVLARMLGSVRVTHAGDTELLPGEVLWRSAFDAVNQRLPAGRERARCKPWLLGVSQAAGRAEGFLAAACFQRAVQVLTQASLEGRVDRLVGLKENVLLGRRIPAGTGLGGAGG